MKCAVLEVTIAFNDQGLVELLHCILYVGEVNFLGEIAHDCNAKNTTVINIGTLQ